MAGKRSLGWQLGMSAYWFAVVILFAAGLAAAIVDGVLLGNSNSVVSHVVALGFWLWVWAMEEHCG